MAEKNLSYEKKVCDFVTKYPDSTDRRIENILEDMILLFY
jgi:hypothetical protein